MEVDRRTMEQLNTKAARKLRQNDIGKDAILEALFLNGWTYADDTKKTIKNTYTGRTRIVADI